MTQLCRKITSNGFGLNLKTKEWSEDLKTRSSCCTYKRNFSKTLDFEMVLENFVKVLHETFC